jgi:hypothetical protein
LALFFSADSRLEKSGGSALSRAPVQQFNSSTVQRRGSDQEVVVPNLITFKCSVAQNEDAESSNDQLTSVDLPAPRHPCFQEIRVAFSFVELLNC